jgi:hypothetical protein
VKQFIALLPWNCDDRQQDGACYGDTALSIRRKAAMNAFEERYLQERTRVVVAVAMAR